MPRQERLDSPGALHHVMIRGKEKRRIVDDDANRNDFVWRLGALQGRAREISDERILGSGEFVERIPREADARAMRQHSGNKAKGCAERVVAAACKKDGVSLTELRSGSRRGQLPAVRVKIVCGLVENYRISVAEVARQVGISTSGVSKILTRSLSS